MLAFSSRHRSVSVQSMSSTSLFFYCIASSSLVFLYLAQQLLRINVIFGWYLIGFVKLTDQRYYSRLSTVHTIIREASFELFKFSHQCSTWGEVFLPRGLLLLDGSWNGICTAAAYNPVLTDSGPSSQAVRCINVHHLHCWCFSFIL